MRLEKGEKVTVLAWFHFSPSRSLKASDVVRRALYRLPWLNCLGRVGFFSPSRSLEATFLDRKALYRLPWLNCLGWVGLFSPSRSLLRHPFWTEGLYTVFHGLIAWGGFRSGHPSMLGSKLRWNLMGRSRPLSDMTSQVWVCEWLMRRPQASGLEYVSN
jgi:hypothetical protein